LIRGALLRLLRDHPADVIVCYHSLFNDLILRTLSKIRAKTPLVTVVIDLVAAHASWFAPGVTRCLVPTEEVRRCGLDCGVPAERLLVTGLPVDRRFVATAQEDPLAVRQELGLDPGLPVVLLVNGAEGMGPLHQLYRAVADSGVHAQLVIIAGRNKRAQAKLSTERSPPVHVKGFVDNMHEWMRAADLLVTKAGPSTISEALVMGLPMVLSGALPGQERPNADYVIRTGAGVWAPTPQKAAAAVKELLRSDNSRLAQMTVRAQTLAQPHAGRRVAEIVWAIADQRTTHQPTQSIK
jgi:1,2-diacylglycerol 3-beta-galactosyltransferase